MKTSFVITFLTLTLILAVTTLTAHAQGISTDELVIYYSFDEDTHIESDVLDESGNGNDGFLHGDNLKIVEGKVNECVELPGEAAEYISVRNLQYVEGIPALSIAVWIKTAQRGIIASWDRSEYFRFSAGDDQLENMTFVAFDNCCQPLSDWHGEVVVTDDKWHHIVVTFNAEAKRIYVDGELDVEAVPVQQVIGPKEPRYGFLGVGSEATDFNGTTGPANWAFNGLMDEFLMYHRALSAEEVERLSKASGNPFAIEPADKLSITWGKIKSTK